MATDALVFFPFLVVVASILIFAVCVQIIKTNDFSSVSKLSMCSAGYLEDKFLHFFVGKKTRRAPLINRGYYVRMHAVHALLRDFFQGVRRGPSEWQPMEGNQASSRRSSANVLVLGAGYDTVFFRIQQQHPEWLAGLTVRFIELDFSDVCSKKAKIIRSQPETARHLIEPVEYSREEKGFTVLISARNYALIGMDLREHEVLKSVIKYLDLDCSSPTFILSEVVLTYIADLHVKTLMSTISATFPLSTFMNYEQGWEHSSSLSVGSYWTHYVTLDEKIRCDHLEPFDEHEEFLEKCRHYVISLGANGWLSYIVDKYNLKISVEICPEKPFRCDRLQSPLQVYGHASALITSKHSDGTESSLLVLVGGVNRSDKSENHAEDGWLETFLLDEGMRGVWIPSRSISPLVHHALVPHSELELLVMGGRTSPLKPNAAVFSICLLPSTVDPGNLSVKVSHVPDLGQTMKLRTGGSGAGTEKRPSSALIAWSNLSADHAVMIQMNFRGLASGLELSGDTVTYDCAAPSIASWGANYVASGGAVFGVAVAKVSLLQFFPARSLEENGGQSLEFHTLTNLSHPRFGHTSHVWRKNLILIGGVSHLDSPVPNITVLHLGTLKQWNFRMEMPPPSHHEEIFMLFNHSSALQDEKNRIIVSGGGGNCFSFGTHFNQDFLVIDLLALEAACLNSE